jgi:hypothetical protein
MALNANALVSVELAKAHLKIPSADTTQTPIIELLINMTSQHIENYCSRSFKSRSVTRYYDGTNQKNVLLGEYPVNSITAVYIDNDRDFDEPTALISPTEYAVIDEEVLRRHDYFWPTGSQNIKVEMNVGFVEIPSDLQWATLQILEQAYRGNQDRRVGRRNTSKGDESVTYLDSWPFDAIAIIDMYKNITFGGRTRPESV